MTAGRDADTCTTVTTAEAAVLLDVTAYSVTRLAKRHQLAGVLVGRGGWLFDRDDVLAYRAAPPAGRSSGPRRRPPRIDAGPLLRQIALRGGDKSVGVRPGSAEYWALEDARERGAVTVWMADRLAVTLLGLTPVELWGDEYLSA